MFGKSERLGVAPVIVTAVVQTFLSNLFNKMDAVNRQRIRDIQTDLQNKANQINSILSTFSSLSPYQQQAQIEDWWKYSKCVEKALNEGTRWLYSSGVCQEAPSKKYYEYDVQHAKEIIRMYQDAVAKAQQIQSGASSALITTAGTVTQSSLFDFVLVGGLFVIAYMLLKSKK